MERNGGSRLMQMQYFSRSWDNINWWETEMGRRPRKVASLSYMNFNPEDLRNGYLTLSDGEQGKAKFQQKQMAERELKIASLYEAQQARALERVRMSPAHSNNGSSTDSTQNGSPRASLAPGKVRQMFEERRSKAGIDKSYLLQPIHNNVTNRNNNNVTKSVVNGHGPSSRVSHARSEKKPVRSHANPVNGVRKQPLKAMNANASGDVNHNNVLNKHEPQINSRSQAPNYLSLDTVDKSDRVSKGKADRNQNHYLIEDETFPDALAEEVTPRSPEPKKPARRNNVVGVKQPAAEVHQPVPPPRKAAAENKVSRNLKSNKEMSPTTTAPVIKKQSTAPSASKQNIKSATSRASRTQPPSASSSAVAAGGPGVACTVCGRRFHPDRIAKHQEICKKAATKKRKPFDVLKHRLAGTEAEPFINKLRKMQANPSQTKMKPLNSTWRKKHDDFIQAIRAAKQVQQHLAAGGNLRDLPPPPPSENPDYVQCPHCSRRFNKAAAERHIPKCASFQFNKPKPGERKR